MSLLVPLLGTLSIAGCGGVDAGNTAPVIQRFAASAPTITAGQTTTLSWEADGAKSVSLSGVSATPAASAVAAPAETTTYRLTATNAPTHRLRGMSPLPLCRPRRSAASR
jgi:hypothetical protein